MGTEQEGGGTNGVSHRSHSWPGQSRTPTMHLALIFPIMRSGPPRWRIVARFAQWAQPRVMPCAHGATPAFDLVFLYSGLETDPHVQGLARSVHPGFARCCSRIRVAACGRSPDVDVPFTRMHNGGILQGSFNPAMQTASCMYRHHMLRAYTHGLIIEHDVRSMRPFWLPLVELEMRGAAERGLWFVHQAWGFDFRSRSSQLG